MKRKSLAGILAITLIAGVSFAQNSNVQSAANAFKFNEMADAKMYIDKAAENEQTSNNYKMWYYRGKIYLRIHADTAWQHLDKDAIEKASISVVNCIKTDEKNWYRDEVKGLVPSCAIGLYNKAAEAYNAQNFERAKRLYTLIFDLFPYDEQKSLKRNNITPEIVYNNLYLASYRGKDYAGAKDYLKKLMDMNYNDPSIYISMARIGMQEKDTAQALMYIEKGRSLYEDNLDLINEEINIYIARNNTDALITKLTDAINLDASREVLFFNRGTLYETRKMFDKAEADYKKALELKPDYFDALYNIGVMFYNQAAEMVNKANQIPPKDTEKYEKAKKEFTARFELAKPYLEKAIELNPKDKNTLISLKELYARTGQLEKSSEMKKRLDALK